MMLFTETQNMIHYHDLILEFSMQPSLSLNNHIMPIVDNCSDKDGKL